MITCCFSSTSGSRCSKTVGPFHFWGLNHSRLFWERKMALRGNPPTSDLTVKRLNYSDAKGGSRLKLPLPLPQGRWPCCGRAHFCGYAKTATCEHKIASVDFERGPPQVMSWDSTLVKNVGLPQGSCCCFREPVPVVPHDVSISMVLMVG